MWTAILSLVVGALPTVISSLAQARVDLANATTEQAKVTANENIKALESKRDVLIANSTSPWDSIMRASILAPFTFYIAWTVAWDKIGCKWFFNDASCTTDPLADWQINILGVLLAYLFVTDVTKIFKR